MTSDTNRTLEAPAFVPAEPEPAPSFEPDRASHNLADATPPAASVRPDRPGSSRRRRLVVNGVLAAAFVVLVGGVAFAAGRATAPATATGANDAGNGLLDGGFAPGAANGGVPVGPGGPGDDDDAGGRLGRAFGGPSVEGTVRAIDADSMTIELADGGTLEIAIDSDTDYHRQADASASDVSTGTTVIVGLDGLRLRDGAGATAGDVTIVP
jgi:hypothetical protein